MSAYDFRLVVLTDDQLRRHWAFLIESLCSKIGRSSSASAPRSWTTSEGLPPLQHNEYYPNQQEWLDRTVIAPVVEFALFKHRPLFAGEQ